MFSIAVIIFREIFEISLIISVLLVATKGMAGRLKWVWLGLLGGTIGSVIVACLAEKITNLAAGMGQELMNAVTLMIASVLIGWTVIWMRRYGRFLTQHFKAVGQSVSCGEKPLYTLAIVIALAVLRDGSEIVLFAYGILASGQSYISMVSGSFLGLISGAAVGAALYFGMVKISPRALFSITSWMLILLAAGMASQAVGFLQAGGFISVLSSTVWDSSKWISDNSLLGNILHTLVGYNAQPSIMQLVIYMTVFFAITVILKFYGNPSLKPIAGKS